MPAPTAPSYQDGLTALSQLTATCLNNGVTYITFDADHSEEGVQKRFSDQNGGALGSDTRVGWKSGTVNMQLALASDVMPRPSFIFLVDSEYFVAGNIGKKLVSNQEVKFSASVLKVVNPIVTSLLSSDGQFKALSLVISVSMTSFPNTAVNGTGTLTWTATGLPAGVTISSSTGALTGTPTVAGTYEAKITVTDSKGKAGYGNLEIVVA